MKARARASLLAATTLALLLSGCIGPGWGHRGTMMDHHGASTSTATGDGTLPMTGDEDLVVEVTAGSPEEYRFTPERIDVQAGQRVGIVVRNVGVAGHELVLDALDFRLTVAAGDTASGAFIAPAPGQLTFGCYIPGHYESGMYGTLVVS